MLCYFLQPFDFPSTSTLSLRRYSIGYRREGGFSFESRVYPRSQVTTFTVERLQFLTTYNFTVRAEVRFSACFRTLLGVLSDVVTATPMETRNNKVVSTMAPFTSCTHVHL